MSLVILRRGIGSLEEFEVGDSFWGVLVRYLRFIFFIIVSVFDGSL